MAGRPAPALPRTVEVAHGRAYARIPGVSPAAFSARRTATALARTGPPARDTPAVAAYGGHEPRGHARADPELAVERPLHCYAYVEAPFDVVTRLLAEDAVTLLQHATDDAAEQADELSHTLRAQVAGLEVSREVTIHVGAFEPVGVTRSLVPLRWEASKGRLLFPELTADLEVSAVVLDPPLTQVTVDGSYAPPLGVLGAGVDRLVLHRLAEATVHRFTHEVADGLRRRYEAMPEDERL